MDKQSERFKGLHQGRGQPCVAHGCILLGINKVGYEEDRAEQYGFTTTEDSLALFKDEHSQISPYNEGAALRL